MGTAIIAAIPAIMSMISGMSEMSSGKADANRLDKNRPQYETPEAATRALQMSMSSLGDMPGTAVQQQRIDASASNMIQNAVMSGNPLAALGGIQAGQNKANQDLQTKNAEYRMSAKDRAAQALGTYAGYKDMEFQMNEYAPWKDRYQMSQNRYGAGAKNLYGGLDSISSIASAYFMGQGGGTTGGGGGEMYFGGI